MPAVKDPPVEQPVEPDEQARIDAEREAGERGEDPPPQWPEQADTIYVLLGRIVGEMPAIGKTKKNEQQGFMFRGHDDVMNALNPILAKYGVIIVPNVLERIATHRAASNNRVMYEVNLRVAFRFYGPAGDCIEASGWGEGTDMGDKATSKAMTMALKYVLATVLALSTAETIDPDGSGPEETYRDQGGKAETPMDINAALGALGVYVEDARPWVKEAAEAFYGVKVDKFSDLKTADRTNLLARLQVVVVSMEKLVADGLDPAKDPDEKVQVQFRTAFAHAFDGLVVSGPEPFKKAIPF